MELQLLHDFYYGTPVADKHTVSDVDGRIVYQVDVGTIWRVDRHLDILAVQAERIQHLFMLDPRDHV